MLRCVTASTLPRDSGRRAINDHVETLGRISTPVAWATVAIELTA